MVRADAEQVAVEEDVNVGTEQQAVLHVIRVIALVRNNVCCFEGLLDVAPRHGAAPGVGPEEGTGPCLYATSRRFR